MRSPARPDFDVIVVGSGLAGHCAALEAVGAGAQVLMVDSEPAIGGSSRLSTGMIMGAGTRFQRERGIDDDPERLYRHYATANQWLVTPSLAHRLCHDAGPTIEWLNDRGVEILDVIASGEEDRPRGHTTAGGAAIIEALSGRLSQGRGVDLALRTRVDRLLLQHGAVAGVAVGSDEIRAGAVVIATGGFAANPELVQEWMGEAVAQANGRLDHQGTPWARGDAILMARQVGAQILSGRGSRAPMWAFGGGYLPGFVMVVNRLGRRFYPETSSYAASELAFVNQPGAMGYMVFDDALKRTLHTRADVEPFMRTILPDTDYVQAGWTSGAIDDHVTAGEMVRAPSLEALAKMIGVPEANLAGAAARYNGHVAAGFDGDYHKPAQHLRPVSTAPYYAAPIKLSLLALTSVGLRVDHDAAVIHETSLPVPGLFAAGECTGGVLGSIYVGSGNSLANCAVFGRAAGRSAAAWSLAR
jgi:succinate dehydrogenase/fumarate reductase flavoprotein subunit